MTAQLNRPAVTDIGSFLNTVLGQRNGHIAIAIGQHPYRDAKGKYQHGDWSEKYYRWPTELDRMLTELGSVTGDTYFCPALRQSTRRTKGSAASLKTCWVDLDGPTKDPALLETLQPLTVCSGSIDHRHIYIPLAQEIELATHERINQRLAELLGGDAKWADNSLLRLPSTWNYKPTVPLNGSDPQPPASVWIEGTAPRSWDFMELMMTLGLSYDGTVMEPAEGAASAVSREPVDFNTIPQPIRNRLMKKELPDRSAAFHGLVSVCRGAGYTHGQTLEIVSGWQPAVDKFGDRLDAEVARSWGKVAPSPKRVTPTKPQGSPADTTLQELMDRAEKHDQRFGAKYFAKAESGPTMFLARTLAEDIMAAEPLAYGIDDRMWVYRGGVWHAAPLIVQNQAAKLLGEQFRTAHSSNAEAVIKAEVPSIACEPVTKYINFRNGLLDWQTGHLVDHDPEVFSTIQLPIEWRPNAACPEFDKFLAEVLPPDCIPLMWEVIGYAMFDDNPLHKAIMLMGSGRNGKGTFLRVLGALLGKTNVSAVTLQALASERFAASGLFGKLANIAGDIDGTYMESTARFKAITGGDVITAEFKFKDQFEFTPRALPIFSANKIPGSADVTVGYLSRWVVLPFPHSFHGREDRGLDARLSTPAELSGIAFKAVSALWDVLLRGNFRETESSKAAFDEFRRKINQVESWLHECQETIPQGWVARSALFSAYRLWAVESGVGPLKAGEFYDRLEAAGFRASKIHGIRGYSR